MEQLTDGPDHMQVERTCLKLLRLQLDIWVDPLKPRIYEEPDKAQLSTERLKRGLYL